MITKCRTGDGLTRRRLFIVGMGYLIRETGLLSCPFQMLGKPGSIFLVINRIKRLCDPIFENGDVLLCAVRFPLMMFRLAGHGLELSCQSRPKGSAEIIHRVANRADSP